MQVDKSDGKTTPRTTLVLGKMVYYPMPHVRFAEGKHVFSVRTFLNPGWQSRFQFRCINCSGVNRIAVHMLEPAAPCKELQGTVAAAANAVATERLQRTGAAAKMPVPPPMRNKMLCPPPQNGPCWGYVDQAVNVGSLLEQPATKSSSVETIDDSKTNSYVTFLLESEDRLPARLRRKLFHRRAAICFYPDDASPSGWLVGYAQFRMDSADVMAFVGFVGFFGIALPLVCFVTFLLHLNKQQRCKQHVQELRLQYQRDQLQQELHQQSSPWTSNATGAAAASSTT